jgi:hypothetical protein
MPISSPTPSPITPRTPGRSPSTSPLTPIKRRRLTTQTPSPRHPQ